MIKENFEIGQQPCKNFIAQDGYFGIQTHDCYGSKDKEKHCEGRVSFCDNCHKDHHSMGYESCAKPIIDTPSGEKEKEVWK